MPAYLLSESSGFADRISLTVFFAAVK